MGRFTFDMMMKSIKEREIDQLASTCFVAAPSIQEGPQIGETIRSKSEDDVDEAPRESVAFKLGNAKELDAKCSIRVATIICPDLVLDPEEDLSLYEDEEDEGVDNILKLAAEGLIFKNDMFRGGCFPSQMQLASKKQKRSVKSNVSRSKKAKPSKNAGGVRTKHQRPITEEGSSSGVVSMESISRI
ncbi:hypothetical protein AtNW77_Chr3g0195451 [Arabidopsis thaliana]